jgi:hypothetical protein
MRLHNVLVKISGLIGREGSRVSNIPLDYIWRVVIKTSRSVLTMLQIAVTFIFLRDRGI